MKRGAGPVAVAVLLLAAATALGNSTLTWKRTWTSPGNRDDVAEAVAVDGAGNVWVAGTTFRGDLSESLNILVQKYSASGALLWTRTHNSYPDGVDGAYGVAVDALGYGYVAGSVSVTGGTSDGWLAKLAPDGSDVWIATYDSPANDQDVFRAVAVDPVTGTVYVAGCERRPDLLQEGNGLVAAFSANGAGPLWATSFDEANLWDEALGVAVAPGGDVVAAGYQTRADPGARLERNIAVRLGILEDKTDASVDTGVVVRRYSAAGVPLWGKTYHADFDSNARQDWARGVVADASGVYVAATVERAGPEYNRWVRKYTPDGVTAAWTRELGGGADQGLRVAGTPALFGSSRVLIAGGSVFEGQDYGSEMTLEQLDPGSGGLLREDAQGSGMLLNDRATACAAMPDGGLVLVGWENRSDLGERKNLVVLRYDDPVTAPETITAPVVWPNPFDPGAAVGGVAKFGGLPPGAVIRIWTPAGRLVRELGATGTTAAWDGRTGDGRAAGPGLYWYRIEAAGVPAVQGSLVVTGRR